MKVSKDKLQADLKEHFAGNEVVATWENEPYIDEAGDEVINVGLSEGAISIKQAQNLPAEVDGVKIIYHYIGEITLMKTTDKYDPLIGGVSLGAIDVTAGTLGGVVWDQETHEPYLLTNEHVVSDTNNRDPMHPPLGHMIVQPGPLDGGMEIAGKLAKVGGMKELAMQKKSCKIDAALIKPVRGFASEEFWGLGYLESLKHVPVKAGDVLIKSGRTTGVTVGEVFAVNVSANISGMAWNNPVAMEGLIQTKTAFVQGGDSGSRAWKRDTMEPIGLVFAGSPMTSFIIPAQTICDVFGVYFGSEAADSPEEPIDEGGEIVKEPIWKQEEFWVAIVTGILVILNQAFGLGIDPEPVLYFVALIFAWIVGSSVKKAALTIREALVYSAQIRAKVK